MAFWECDPICLTEQLQGFGIEYSMTQLLNLPLETDHNYFSLLFLYTTKIILKNALKGTKFAYLAPLGIFKIIHTYLEWNYLCCQ